MTILFLAKLKIGGRSFFREGRGVQGKIAPWVSLIQGES